MNVTCVGIILDGNRRWAKDRGLSKLEGHRAGLRTFKNTVRFVRDRGVKHLIVYMFSTENWNREPAEVSYLMDLFRHVLADEIEHMQEKGVRVLCIGARERFSPELQALMRQAEERTAGNKELTLALCLSYGGRAEIVGAVNRAIAAGKKEVDEETFARYLWTVGIPDPDLIIRTSGEMRLSGFLPWQGVYSELFFTKTLWPDFTEAEFKSILEEFSRRDRRLGR